MDLTLPGGLAGRVVRANRDHAEVWLHERMAAEPVTVRVRYGQPVQVESRTAPLVRKTKVTRAASGAGDGNGTGTGGGSSGASRRVVEDVDETDLDPELFEALRTWRLRVASEHGVPPYLVFHDRHLRLIAGRKPATLRELAACPGVGPAKLERYGDDVLDVVTAHA